MFNLNIFEDYSDPSFEIIQKELPFVFKKLNEIDVFEFSFKNNISTFNRNTDFEKILKSVTISFKRISDNKTINKEIYDYFNNLYKLTDRINNVAVNFCPGRGKIGVDKMINSYNVIIYFKENIAITKDELFEVTNNNKKIRHLHLKRLGVISFLEKYKINNINDFLKTITYATRDVNRYAKIVTDKAKKKHD